MTTSEPKPAPSNVWDLVTAIGTRNLTRRLGIAAFSTVQAWKEVGRIPPQHWLAVIQLCDELNIPGVNASSLAIWHAATLEGRNG